MPRLHSTWLVFCLVQLGLVGYGGDSQPTFTRESVQDSMTQMVREQIAGQGATMDPLRCVQDGDEFPWRCIPTLLDAQQRSRVTLTIPCDGETAECLSGPATLLPLP